MWLSKTFALKYWIGPNGWQFKIWKEKKKRKKKKEIQEIMEHIIYMIPNYIIKNK